MSDLIPTTSDGARIATVALTNVTGALQIRTYWNYTQDMWFMDVLRPDDTAIARGLALVPNINVSRNFPIAFAQIGEFRIIDQTGRQNAFLDTLGTDSLLVRFEPGEIERTYEITRPLERIYTTIPEFFT